MKFLSIRAKMILIALGPAFLVSVVLTLYFVVNQVRSIEQAALLQARTLAEGLALASEFAIAAENDVLLQSVSNSILHVNSIQSVWYQNASDELIGEFPNQVSEPVGLGFIGSTLRPYISKLPIQNRVSYPVWQTELPEFDDPLFVDDVELVENRAGGLSVESSGDGTIEKRQIGTVNLTVDLSAAYQQQLSVIGKSLTFLGFLFPVMVVAAAWLAGTVSRPIQQLTQAVEQLARNDYDIRTGIDRDDELGALNEGVIHLSSELQSFHQRLTESTLLATKDLHNALDELERQNVQLEDARLSAEQASAFKSEFLANMSHEIRTPMNTILGTLSMMTLSPLNDEQLKQVQAINQSSENLLVLIDDILDISRIESGNLMLEEVETDLDEILKETSHTAAQLAVNKGIEAFVAPLPDSWLRWVKVDAVRLKQVVFNLISNAIKFTHHGHVFLDLQVRERDGNHCVLDIIVQDTGIGIPQSKLENIFSAFAQVDMSTTRKYGGTGLGLHICREIVALMKGQISVSSIEGKGSQFTVSLPLEVCRLAEEAASPPEEAPIELCYVDAYQPLVEPNLLALVNAGVELADDERSNAPELINVLNKAIQEDTDWSDAYRFTDDNKQRLALVSIDSLRIRQWIQQVGFSGYVLRTPHLGELRRSIEHALAGDSFEFSTTQKSRTLSDNIKTAGLSVLAADDQAINLSLLKQYFSHLGVSADYADSGEAAVVLAGSKQYDLILLDIHMPGCDGYQAAHRIHSQCPVNATTPLIAVTADAFSSTRDRALKSGFSHVVTKPMTIDEIQEVFESVIGGAYPANTSLPVENVGTVTDIKTQAIGKAAAALQSIVGGSSGDRSSREFPVDDNRDRQRVVDTVTRFDHAESVDSETALVSLERCAAGVLGDTDWARNALTIYREEVPNHVDSLTQALQARDRNKLFQAAHGIKSTSAICRIHSIVSAATIVEMGSEADSWALLESCVADLQVLLQQAATDCHKLTA